MFRCVVGQRNMRPTWWLLSVCYCCDLANVLRFSEVSGARQLCAILCFDSLIDIWLIWLLSASWDSDKTFFFRSWRIWQLLCELISTSELQPQVRQLSAMGHLGPRYYDVCLSAGKRQIILWHHKLWELIVLSVDQNIWVQWISVASNHCLLSF